MAKDLKDKLKSMDAVPDDQIARKAVKEEGAEGDDAPDEDSGGVDVNSLTGFAKFRHRLGLFMSSLAMDAVISILVVAYLGLTLYESSEFMMCLCVYAAAVGAS